MLSCYYMKFNLLVFFLSFYILKAKAQNTLGLPEIINYQKQVYHAGTQNWKICQDRQGIIYIANNEGLLSFDGNFWKKYKTLNATGIRSLAVAGNGRIYIGAQGEIGYFEPDTRGCLQYHCLNNLIPESEKDFTDVWDVILYGDDVFFRSYKKIFQLKNGKITVYSSISWSFMGLSNGQLVSKAYGKGLLQFQNGTWAPLVQKDTLPENTQVTGLVPLDRESSLLVTKKHGFYILKGGQLTPFITPDIREIAAKNPYAATTVHSDQIAIATNLEGCFIINTKGELIQRLSKLDGLQNNNVLSVFTDRNKNLWLGLDNGIDFVAYNNAIKHVYPDYQEHSAGKASIIYNNNLYLGTANGLYKAAISTDKDISFVKGDFKLIPGTMGQVWNLSEVNGSLVMGHNDGFFQIRDQTAQVIDGSTGFWNFLPLSSVIPSPIVIAGTYNGINFYNFENGHFSNPSIHSHFESARYLAIDNNIIWVSHPFKGLYKVEWDAGGHPSYTAYKDKKGILSSNDNYLFKIKSRIVLTNTKGIFEYNSKTDDFEPSNFLRSVLLNGSVQYLKEDNSGNIWFVQNSQLGIVDLSGAKPQIMYFPELNDKIMTNGFESIYPYNNSNIFIAGEEGFYHLNYEQYKANKEPVPILISAVKIINKADSTIFGGYLQTETEGQKMINHQIPEISYAWNTLHFDYSSLIFGQQSSIEYSYFLEDFDKSWSAWSKKTEKEYTYLAPGTYTFKVKARTHEGEESVVASYRFTILPPWYRTVWAYSLYLLLAGALLYSLYRWQMKKFTEQQKRHEEESNRLKYLNQLQAEKHEEEQKQLMYLHQLELERTEKELIRLRNEKLESEIQVKNTELASATLNLIQKGEMLVKVKEEFVRMKKTSDLDKDSDEYKKILRMLGDDKLNKNWDQFALHFDTVHSNFLVTMKKHYPNLTPSELKLCAYLRLNLSSKEIAQIMNITIKSVELARYRLRKKLQLQPDVNLFNFLLNFHSEKMEEDLRF